MSDVASAATNEEMCASTLAHYERVSTIAHEWNNQVPQAIKAWYENRDLRGELAQAREDAERYRWLRVQKRADDYYADVDNWSVAVERRGTGRVLRAEQLDAAIDAARNNVALGADAPERN